MTGKVKRVLLLVLVGVVLAGGGLVGYFVWRPRPVVIPPIATEGLDPEVIAFIDGARADVLAQPRSGAAWGRLGMVLFAQDRYEDCVAFLVEAERLEPSEPRWPYFLGLALVRKEPQQGIAALQRAAALPPPAFPIRLRLAEQYLELQRLDEADTLFGELLAEVEDDPRVLLGRGRILAQRGQLKEAVAPLTRAAEHPTAQRSARIALAEVHARLGNTAAAEMARQRAEQAGADRAWPDPLLTQAERWRTGLQVRIDQARALLRDGELAQALALLAEVLEEHPNSDEAHLNLARALIRAGRTAEADKALRKAITLNARLSDAHFLLAILHAERNEQVEAERSLRRTLELKPTYAEAHFNLGTCLRQQGKKAAAIAAYREAVRCRPELAAAQLELGALLLQEGEAATALPHLENACRLDGKNDRARRLLGEAQRQR